MAQFSGSGDDTWFVNNTFGSHFRPNSTLKAKVGYSGGAWKAYLYNNVFMSADPAEGSIYYAGSATGNLTSDYNEHNYWGLTGDPNPRVWKSEDTFSSVQSTYGQETHSYLVCQSGCTGTRVSNAAGASGVVDALPHDGDTTDYTPLSSFPGVDAGLNTYCPPYDFYGRTSVTIPASVTSIGVAAFAYCPALIAIAVDLNNAAYTSVEGVLFDRQTNTVIQYPGGKAGSYTLAASVTSIGSGAFAECTGLTGVSIPNSLTSIGVEAFMSLHEPDQPHDPRQRHHYFGDGAFSHCTGLTNVTIPSSVASIGHMAFYGCSGLTNVSIPNRLTSIGGWAFRY